MLSTVYEFELPVYIQAIIAEVQCFDHIRMVREHCPLSNQNVLGTSGTELCC
jgi:hypothetical protein